MEEHSAEGEGILAEVDGWSEIATIVRHHHERWDGQGYPDRLAGEALGVRDDPALLSRGELRDEHDRVGRGGKGRRREQREGRQSEGKKARYYVQATMIQAKRVMRVQETEKPDLAAFTAAPDESLSVPRGA